jgi:sodium-dependent dicarboxylate transporter 2/3/5
LKESIGLVAGLVAFAVIAFLPAPEAMPREAQLTAALATWMAVWWVTEAVPVAATALLPLVLMPALGVMSAGAISAPYASRTNMLFLGGLMIAMAIQRWDLHRRIALSVVSALGTNLDRLVLGFMAATAGISMWISNAATTMMPLPIAMAVVDHVRRSNAEAGHALAPILMLAVAYSATVGGIATIVGTPPNAVFVGSFAQLFPDAQEIGFLQWMLVGVPIVLVTVPLVWLYLVKVAVRLSKFRVTTDADFLRTQLAALGPVSTPEKRLLVVFVATALLWMTRRSLEFGAFTLPGWSTMFSDPALIGDSTVAIGMASLLFALPAGDDERSRLLDWDTAVRLPWGVILLLGGGFAMAEAIRVSGLAVWIGGELAWVGQANPLVSIAVIALTISFVTEITTNTAITTIMMPVLAASAAAGGCDPLLLMIPCTLAASLCFMMPSGTAPNAIVFSGGELSVAFMARTGLPLNLLGVVVVVLITYFVAIPAFDISLDGTPSWAAEMGAGIP